MAVDRNFKINRIKGNGIKLSTIKVGDVFEREGSLHMRVDDGARFATMFPICNLDTGEVWRVDDQIIIPINRESCEINYQIPK